MHQHINTVGHTLNIFDSFSNNDRINLSLKFTTN
jgi:hypothetical protein